MPKKRVRPGHGGQGIGVGHQPRAAARGQDHGAGGVWKGGSRGLVWDVWKSWKVGWKFTKCVNSKECCKLKHQLFLVNSLLKMWKSFFSFCLQMQTLKQNSSELSLNSRSHLQNSSVEDVLLSVVCLSLRLPLPPLFCQCSPVLTILFAVFLGKARILGSS